MYYRNPDISSRLTEIEVTISKVNADLRITFAVKIMAWTHIALTWDRENALETLVLIDGQFIHQNITSSTSKSREIRDSYLFVANDANNTYANIAIDEMKFHENADNISAILEEYCKLFINLLGKILK